MELKVFLNNNSLNEDILNNNFMNIAAIMYDTNMTDNNNTYNRTFDPSMEIDPILYLYFTPIMIFISIISLIVNFKILCSMYWIRRPVSPTLQISLSLAAADGVASFLLGFGLFLNSLLPQIIDIQGLDCYQLTLETFRVSSVICSVLHLLALTGNHYLGILKPLQYSSLMTGRNTKIMLLFLWLVPNTFYFVYFTKEGFLYDCESDFLGSIKFRMVYALLFFIPFIIMVIIYGHVYIIIKRHQRDRAKYINKDQSSTRRNSQNRTRSKQQHIMNKNMKAIRTTMYIIGSYFIGLIPLTIVYCLVCEDCIYKLKYVHKTYLFYLLVTLNTLCILKTLVNPLIYAARMQDIKSASIKMNTAFYRKFCGSRGGNEPHRCRMSSSTMHKHSKTNSTHITSNNFVCTKL